jgi:hypothetical protein
MNFFCGDLHFEETTCRLDGEPFKPGDKIALVVREVTDKGISCVPMHADDENTTPMKFTRKELKGYTKNRGDV